MAVTTGDNVSSQLTEAQMTIHIRFVNLCTACTSTPYNFFFFSLLVFTIKKTHNKGELGSMKQII